MEFFLEMLLTAVVAVLFSFLVAKLVSVSMVGNSGGVVNDQAEETEIGVVAVEEELCSGLKVDAPVVQSERRLGAVVVDENVERVDRFGSEADRVVDEVKEGTKGEDWVVTSDESSAAGSPENVIAEEMMVCGEDKQRDAAEEFNVRTVGAESTASVSLENVRAEEIMIDGEEVRSEEDVISGELVVAESEDVRVEESNTVEESENKMEFNTKEGDKEEKKELSIEEEEDDDWEGIERSELEKAFAATSSLLEVSGKAEEVGDEVKMELYGLYMIATEGSCRETQPMAIMVSARAKWNAWQKLGNMSQEEAMEKYLALVSKEIPGLMNTVGKIPVLPPNSGSLEDPTTLGTTGVAFSKNGKTN
ncbi:acyl-CoA-binding domain-containing protein 3 isoform X1 [Brassica rapa]|uniref:ACB domain-containing protein n=1 Tax=Brassica campestris TaxID=3711 RepID=A0A3P6A2D0_BRACM|nr:acyl-CoA-binding domain-containing protein 3 isoform X1 [Brassica rapa]CAG7884253.1 unnamed protein product [Brassica rapa]VDC83355.1 unnamed protein product [Brassica rapa]